MSKGSRIGSLEARGVAHDDRLATIEKALLGLLPTSAEGRLKAIEATVAGLVERLTALEVARPSGAGEVPPVASPPRTQRVNYDDGVLLRRVLQLRAEGQTFAEIGAAIGVNAATATRMRNAAEVRFMEIDPERISSPKLAEMGTRGQTRWEALGVSEEAYFKGGKGRRR